MSIRHAISELSARWINPEYARQVNLPTQVDHMIVYAFINRVPEGEETALLREAHKRLQACALVGDWP